MTINELSPLMRIRKTIVAAFYLLGIGMICANVNLPKTEIQGKEYYYYEVKKDDSLYGIAKRFGWDEATLVAANPVSHSNLKKGQRIYYPVLQADTDRMATMTEQEYSDVCHEVKRGETVYGIALLYGLTPDEIYAANPSARYGIKAGETLIVQKQGSVVVSDQPGEVLYYTARPGDTLMSVAEAYRTSVTEILKLNPALSENDFATGSTIRIRPNTDSDNMAVRQIEKRQVNSFKPYKIEKNDTWTAISQAHDITIEELREANEGITELKKGRYLSIPVYENVTLQEEYIIEDPREKTIEGRQDLYDELHNVAVVPTEEKSVNVALLLTVADNRNREAEFLRGVLMAVDELKNEPYKINLNVYDVTAAETPLDSLLSIPRFAENDIVLTTFEKDFPTMLAEYGDARNIEVVNVFDVKSDLFNLSPSFIQVLPPTSYFNEAVSDYIINNFSDATYVFVGKSNPDDTDALDNMIRAILKENGSTFIELDESAQLEVVGFEEGKRYIVCPQLTKKGDIDLFLSAMAAVKEAVPLTDISVLARPNWIVYTEKFGEKFALLNTLIPSRFYYDQTIQDAQIFTDTFTSKFGETPKKSNPTYSVLGYDVAKFFIKSTAYNAGDPNAGFIPYDALQTDFRLERTSNWSGLLNQCCYIVRFTSQGIVEKITL